MTKKKQFDFSILLFVFLPLVLLGTQNITVTFLNNDDLYLKLLASGEFTGTPETHLLHINYLTGVVLSCLYNLFPSFPWYGFLLFSYGYLGITLSLYMITKQIQKTYWEIFYAVLFLFVGITFIGIHIIELQFTTITAITCATSLIYFYLSEESDNIATFLKNNIPSILFFFLAIELRDNACIMFLPTFFLVGLVKCIHNRKMFNPILAYGAILLTLVIFTWSINQIAYSSEEWKSFETYNNARATIIDYNGYPDYEEYQAEYNDLGVSYQSYLSATTRYQLLLDENINKEFMVKMAELSEQTEVNFKQMLGYFMERHITSYLDRPLNLIVYVFYFFTILLILASKRWKAFGDLLALFIGRMIIWGYLLFIGRTVARVTQGVYIMEFLLLLSIIFKHQLCFTNMHNSIPKKKKFSLSAIKNYIFHKKNIPQRIVIIFFICASIFTSIKWGIPHIDMIRRYSAEQAYFSCAFNEIREYFYEHENNLYLLDINSFSHFTEDAFSKTPASHGNYMPMGSWPANSPWSDKVANRYNISSYERDAIMHDNIYFVFMNTDGTSYEYLEDYFQSKYPSSAFVLCDTFYTSNGLEFYIMQVQS